MADTKTKTTKAPAKAPTKSATQLASKPTSKPTSKPAGKLAVITEPGEPVKGTRTGVVETDGRSKTRKVVVAYLSPHPKYGKYVQKRTVLHVHDENNVSKVGDIVEVRQCRPISKTKSWSLLRIVESRSDIAAALASARQVQ